jgi:CHASE3 domain sensor protein
MRTASRPNWKVELAFGSAILALLIVGAVSYRGMVVSTESDHWMVHTHEVVESLADLRFAMERVEASSQGFVLTGSDSYLDTYAPPWRAPSGARPSSAV